MKNGRETSVSAIYDRMRFSFRQAGLDTPDLDSRIIIESCTDLRWADLIANPDSPLTTEQISACEASMVQRLERVPIARIFGEREFWGLTFMLTPETLEPRPDTETLVEAALRLVPKGGPERILDLGTGTGCILLSLLSEWPQAYGIGVDRAEGAVMAARENARRLGFDSRAAFLCGSWADSLVSGFDLVVPNPPYIRNQLIRNLAPEVRNHDPALALEGGDDGLQAYREIFSDLKRLLKAEGKALFEIGFDQEKSVVQLAENEGFYCQSVYRDTGGIARVVEISCGDK